MGEPTGSEQISAPALGGGIPNQSGPGAPRFNTRSYTFKKELCHFISNNMEDLNTLDVQARTWKDGWHMIPYYYVNSAMRPGDWDTVRSADAMRVTGMGFTTKRFVNCEVQAKKFGDATILQGIPATEPYLQIFVDDPTSYMSLRTTTTEIDTLSNEVNDKLRIPFDPPFENMLLKKAQWKIGSRHWTMMNLFADPANTNQANQAAKNAPPYDLWGRFNIKNVPFGGSVSHSIKVNSQMVGSTRIETDPVDLVEGANTSKGDNLWPLQMDDQLLWPRSSGNLQNQTNTVQKIWPEVYVKMCPQTSRSGDHVLDAEMWVEYWVTIETLDSTPDKGFHEALDARVLQTTAWNRGPSTQKFFSDITGGMLDEYNMYLQKVNEKVPDISYDALYTQLPTTQGMQLIQTDKAVQKRMMTDPELPPSKKSTEKPKEPGQQEVSPELAQVFKSMLEQLQPKKVTPTPEQQ